MQSLSMRTIRTGLASLDALLQGVRLGDNEVWQVDQLEDYPFFAQAFAGQAIRDGLDCVYLRFAPHTAILEPRPGLTITRIDHSSGFDYFAGGVHRIIEERGRRVCYIFDNLSALVDEWVTDELLANFFQVTCPYFFEVDPVAYFALSRSDLMSLTEEYAKVTGIPYLMNAYREEAIDIIEDHHNGVDDRHAISSTASYPRVSRMPRSYE